MFAPRALEWLLAVSPCLQVHAVRGHGSLESIEIGGDGYFVLGLNPYAFWGKFGASGEITDAETLTATLDDSLVVSAVTNWVTYANGRSKPPCWYLRTVALSCRSRYEHWFQMITVSRDHGHRLLRGVLGRDFLARST